MRLKDSMYMLLAVIGFAIITIVTLKNYDIKQDEREFGAGTYYTPREVKSKTDSSIELYMQMTGSRKLTCPQVSLEKTTENTINLTSIYSTSYENRYGAKTIFISATSAGAKTKVLSSSDDSKTMLENIGVLSENTNNAIAGEFKLGDLWDIAEGTYVELIAPFNFQFGNVNTTSEDTIVIVNMKNNCRITFNNVANWFCAGKPGTTQVTSNGSNDNTTSWEKHSHRTIIGSTTNAKVNGGSVKDVIGYATRNTSVLIEVYGNDGWAPVSLYSFMTDSSKQ